MRIRTLAPRLPGVILATTLLAALAAPSARAQTGGNDPANGKTSQDGFTVIDLLNPITGVDANRNRVRAFQVYSSTGCKVMLKIYRPWGATFRLIGTSLLYQAFPGRVETFACDIPVEENDLVGFTTVNAGSGGIDYLDDDETLSASVIYQGDVGTVLVETGTIKHYVRSIRVLGIPSADVETDFRTISWIPVVARATSATGTLFRTEAVLHNPATGADIDVTLTFYPSGENGYEKGTAKILTLKPLEVRKIGDVVKDVFGLDAGSGFVRVTGLVPIHSRWRIVNETPGGLFGQDLPALSGSDSLIHDTQVLYASGATFQLVGAEESDAYRTNLGIVNLDSAEVEVNVQPFDSLGVALAENKVLKLKPLSQWQWNNVLAREFFLPHGVSNVRLVVSPNDKSLTGRIFTYMSIVDNVTGDAVFVEGAKPASF